MSTAILRKSFYRHKERICGHSAYSHNHTTTEASPYFKIAHQVRMGKSPKVRKLASHIISYPQGYFVADVNHELTLIFEQLTAEKCSWKWGLSTTSPLCPHGRI